MTTVPTPNLTLTLVKLSKLLVEDMLNSIRKKND